MYASLQILLPWDMFGLFLLFVLDQKKKVISILDPLPIPNSGRNILKAILKNLNLALKVANPSLKHDISKWGCEVHGVPTNSYGYESCQCITIFIDSFNTQYIFLYMQCSVGLCGFQFHVFMA